MDPLATRRGLQVVTGTLLGLAVVSLVVLVFPRLPGASSGAVLELRPAGGLTGGLFGQVQPAPPFSLEDPSGTVVTEEVLEGQVSVFFFGFTHCPDVCPITLTNLTRAFHSLEDDGSAPQGFFVSVDPRRDTPQVLERYMERFHPSLKALTGPEEEVLHMAREWGIHVAYVPLEGQTAPEARAPDGATGEHHHHDSDAEAREEGGEPTPPSAGEYTVDHTARALVVDREGRIVHTLAPYLTPEEIVEELRPLLAP